MDNYPLVSDRGSSNYYVKQVYLIFAAWRLPKPLHNREDDAPRIAKDDARDSQGTHALTGSNYCTTQITTD